MIDLKSNLWLRRIVGGIIAFQSLFLWSAGMDACWTSNDPNHLVIGLIFVVPGACLSGVAIKILRIS